jgi:two-component system, NtrC family, response regulator AtoC
VSGKIPVRILVLCGRGVLQSAMRKNVLFSFVGNHDPLEIPRTDSDPGPVLSLLRAHAERFDHVALFLTGGDYVERAQVIKDVALREGLARTFSFIDIRLKSVVDYEELYEVMSTTVLSTRENLGIEGECSVLLDPGTPQMQTIWFLLAQAGILPARLLQGIPARFGGGTYQYREVRVRPDRIPIEMRLRTKPPHEPPAAEAVLEWTGREDEIVGDSPVMKELLRRVDQFTPYDEVVLITGETGTGKELIARRLHTTGPRRKGPFTAVNVATLEGATAASALFGHTRGAYTGAEANRLGAFRSSEKGTLFLDEIGELSPEMQARILRAVELKEVVPLGEDRPRHVDVRVVAATNRDLAAMIRDGTFRQDLYQRLRQFPLEIPPLRDRTGDIALLAGHLLEAWNRRYDMSITVSLEAIAVLQDYQWPGNVRQLENVLKRLCVPVSPGGAITAEAARAIITEERHSYEERLPRPEARGPDARGPDARGLGARGPDALGREARGPDARGLGARGPDGVRSATASPEPQDLTTANPVDLRSILEETERGWYNAALRAANGNQAEAARLLGLKPPGFRKALRDRFPDLLG